jgi:hypothetical protein
MSVLTGAVAENGDENDEQNERAFLLCGSKAGRFHRLVIMKLVS